MPKIIGKRHSRDEKINSYWPRWARRVFETLKEIPWFSLTAICTVSGALVLFSYFRSIDYFPSDFSSLISLGAAAAVCSGALVVALAFGLFAPVAIYQQYATQVTYEKPGQAKAFSTNEMVVLQLGGVGWVFSFSSYPQYFDCDILSWYAIPGLLLFVLGVGAFARIIFRKGSAADRLHGAVAAFAISVLTAAPFFMLIPLKEVLTFQGFDSSIALLALWALAILANASLIKLPGGATAVIAIVVVGILYICIPMITERPNFFPKMVASYLGVREEKVQNLVVPRRTCELIRIATIRSVSSGGGVNCAEGEWTKISAWVLSNVGEQWLIEVEDGLKPSEPHKLRLTVPKHEIQVLNRSSSEAGTQKSATCGKP